ncbi:MAG TPA: hypothetical protein VFL79_15475 [Terriglobia bacterium]|nr:hypothetical protein [Terriglobia bacterium]
MKEHPDHHDAELMLRLYDLRREEKLRRAREWFALELRAESAEDFMKKYPPGSEQDAYFRMVVTYWEMAASIVNNGLIKQDFFFQNTAEFFGVWERIRHLMPDARKAFKNPHMWENLEQLAANYETWMAKRAPEAIDAYRQRVKALQKK